MEPLDYVKAVAARWRIVVAVVLAAVVAAAWTTPASPGPASPVDGYQATATLLRSPADPNPNPPPLAYVTLFTTVGGVPARVAKTLGYKGSPAELASTIRVVPDDTTGSVQITAEGPDGRRDARVANAFSAELINTLVQTARRAREDQIGRLSEQRTAAWASVRQNSGSSNVALQQKAQSDGARFADLDGQIQDLKAQNTQPAPPFTVLQAATPVPAAGGGVLSAPRGRAGRVLLGGMAGLLAGIALALLVARVDTRLRTRAEVEGAFDLPVLADIPRASLRARRGFRIAVVDNPGGAVADGYRSLRSTLLLLDPRQLIPGRPTTTIPDGPRVVLVTSARAGEGKTTTVVNLAAAMAETGRRVLVVDCDLRNPMAYRYLKVEPGQGITDLPVAGGIELKAPTCVPQVDLIQAGTGAFAHVAVSMALPGIIEAARKQADVIFIDAPPLLAGAAMEALSVADSVLLVCRSGRTSRDQAQRARDLIERVGVPTYGIGFVASAESALSRIFPLPSERRSGQVPAGAAAGDTSPVDKAAPIGPPGASATAAPDDARPTVPSARSSEAAPRPSWAAAAGPADGQPGPALSPPATPMSPSPVEHLPTSSVTTTPAEEPARADVVRAEVHTPEDPAHGPAVDSADGSRVGPLTKAGPTAETQSDAPDPPPQEPLSIAQRVGREPVSGRGTSYGASRARGQATTSRKYNRRGRR